MTDSKMNESKTSMTRAHTVHASENALCAANYCRDEAIQMGLTGAFKCDTNFELFFDCLKEVR